MGAARPLPQRREILHQADIAGPFGMEGRSDRFSLRWGIHARRHEVPGMVRPIKPLMAAEAIILKPRSSFVSSEIANRAIQLLNARTGRSAS